MKSSGVALVLPIWPSRKIFYGIIPLRLHSSRASAMGYWSLVLRNLSSLLGQKVA